MFRVLQMILLGSLIYSSVSYSIAIIYCMFVMCKNQNKLYMSSEEQPRFHFCDNAFSS